jgi:glycerol-3-phosphate O-acyltransferase
MENPESRQPESSKGALRRWICRALQGTHHHYRNVLPDRLGPLRSRALRVFYSGIRLEEAQAAVLQNLPPDGIVVYATRFRPSFPLLFAYTRHRQLGLPYPRIGLGCRLGLWQPLSHLFRVLLAHADSLVRKQRLPDPYMSGFFRDELLQGKAGFFSLIEKRGRIRRFLKTSVDPVAFLISVQKSTERPVLIVPQIMFFSRNPGRSQPNLTDMLFGTEDKPGRLRRLAAMFKNPGNVFAEISPPICVRSFLERPDIARQPVEYQAALLRGELLAQIARHRQSIIGPVLKSRTELKESILTSERFQQFLQAHAEKHQMSVSELRAKAAGCIDEIAADPSPNWIRFYSAIDGWILRTLFDGITMNADGLAAVKRASLRGPVIYIPSHKSHVDYLILSYMLYHKDLPCPLVAAGKNLSFWPMGPLFRRGGAFFIRRSFRGAVLYSKVFAEYVHKILEEGYTIEQFIEGGRSRTGKLLPPKLGLLSILLTALKNGACEDLTFVPVSIGYDQILEEKSYLQEIEGIQKKPESLWQVLKARKFLKRRYGKVYLRFSEPISVNDLAHRVGSPLKAMGTKEFNGFCRSLGHRIVFAIDRTSVVTPYALTAAAILNSGRERLDFQEVMEAVDIYMNRLYAIGANFADTLIMDHHRAVTQALESFVQRKILDSAERDPRAPVGSSSYILNETKRPFLEYYKNTCIAFFIPTAFTALTILKKDAFQFSASDLHTDYELLQDLFQLEFIFDCEAPAEHHLRKTLKAFVDDAVLIPHPTLPDTYNVTAVGFRRLKLFAMFLKTLLESYWIVLSYFMQTTDDAEDVKDRARKISSFGNRMFRLKEIDHREALSKITFENAVEFFTSRGIKTMKDRQPIEMYAGAIQRALTYLRH